MISSTQQIRFCTSRDGTRIAYATWGTGPALIWIPHWAHHIRSDWDSPVWRPWLTLLSRNGTLITHGWRGCGLSDRKVEFSFGRYLEDLDALVASCGAEQFTLFGMAAGADLATHYAANHPERVARVILYASKSRGRLAGRPTAEATVEADARLKVMQLGWPNENPAYSEFFTSLHMPDATPEQKRSYNELLRITTSPENISGLIRSYWRFEMGDTAQRVRCPVLVLHARQDLIIPFDEGRSVAAMIPNATFVPLESRDHILVDSEPAWHQFAAAVQEFLPAANASVSVKMGNLTPRERDVLQVLARGLNNAAIATKLSISEKTVRNVVSSIFAKLSVRTRAEAVARARDAGIGSVQ